MKAKIKSKLKLEGRVLLQDVIPLDTPFLIYVDPSSLCNFKCRFCPTGHKDLIKESTYKRNILDFGLFKKIISGLGAFNSSLKVLRMNKIGEPLLNKNLAEMIKFAKDSGFVDYIDLATNGSLFSKKLMQELVSSGLDRLNISVEGINKQQYLENALVHFDFEHFVDNIHWLHENKNDCEIAIKIPSNYLNDKQKKEFFDIFGDHCDLIFIEELVPIWPQFDLEKRAKVAIQSDKGQYQQPLANKDICSFIFYSLAVNSDGTVSACCPDWNQKLIVGDLRNESIYEIWNSEKLKSLQLQHLNGYRCDNEVCSYCGHLMYAQVDNLDPYREQILNNFKKAK